MISEKISYNNWSGKDDILYMIKDISNQTHFMSKTIIKFATKMRALNDDHQTIEITEHNNQIIKVNCNSIRDLEYFNPYSKWIEVNDINNNKIIVKHANLFDCRELIDKKYLKRRNSKNNWLEIWCIWN